MCKPPFYDNDYKKDTNTMPKHKNQMMYEYKVYFIDFVKLISMIEFFINVIVF